MPMTQVYAEGRFQREKRSLPDALGNRRISDNLAQKLKGLDGERGWGRLAHWQK